MQSIDLSSNWTNEKDVWGGKVFSPFGVFLEHSKIYFYYNPAKITWIVNVMLMYYEPDIKRYYDILIWSGFNCNVIHKTEIQWGYLKS